MAQLTNLFSLICLSSITSLFFVTSHCSCRRCHKYNTAIEGTYCLSFLSKLCLFSCIVDEDFSHLQPWHMSLLGWDCQDECSYMCMWRTVDAYEKDDERIQQFHGKVVSGKNVHCGGILLNKLCNKLLFF